MEQNCVLLDTSFFIRLLNEEDSLHENALGYFKYFLEHDFVIKISTIAIAEVYAEKKKRGATIAPRAVVPNDTKMFAQADVEPDINFYGTADVECKKVYDMVKTSEGKLSFDFIDITIPYTTFFGVLNFEE